MHRLEWSTHGKPNHGNTADEQLVLLREANPTGRAEDAVLGLGLRRSNLIKQHHHRSGQLREQEPKLP